MTGGILQLVAYGVQDVFLFGNPQITFFKTVYRRHTNFSREEFNLKFNNNLDFGKEATCKIARNGDLLHRLFLVIQLPKIAPKYTSTTNRQISESVKRNNIDWSTTINPDYKFNTASYKELKKKISNEINLCSHKLQISKNISDSNNIEILLANSDDNTRILYDTINKKFNDEPIYKLYNVNEIKNLMVDNIFNLIVPNSNSYNYENIKFIYNLELCNDCTQFDSKINNVYGDFIPEYLDACKIFNLYKTKIKTNSNIKHVMKTIITNNILYALNKNQQLLSNIYDSFATNIKLIFYRDTNDNTTSSNKNTKLLFHNISQLNNHYDDNFTNQLYSTKINNIYFPFGDYVNDNLQILNNDNINVLNNNLFNDYFNDTKLWFRTNLGAPGDSYLDTDNIYNIKMENMGNIYCLNLIPFLTNNDIHIGINKYLNSNMNNMDNTIELIDGLSKIKSDIYNKIKFLLDDIITDPQEIINLYSNTTNRINYMCIFKKYIINDMPIPKYIISTYIEFINNFNWTTNNIGLRDNIINIINLFKLDDPTKLISYNVFTKNSQNIDLEYKLNPITINNENHYLSFVVSSLWYYITNTIIDNYKKFYTNVLDVDYIDKQIGGDILSTVKYINKNYTNINETNYWKTYDVNKIKRYMVTKTNSINCCTDNYRNKLDTLKQINNGQMVGVDDINYNTFNDLYNRLLLEFGGNTIIVDRLVEIFKEKSIFETNKDLYRYILDYSLKNWTVMDDINNPGNLVRKIDSLNVFKNELKQTIGMAEQTANFAWIKRIGFYIIDNVSITIGGQLMDKHTGEWLNIWYELTKERSKERGYNKLIGDINELTIFNKIPKKTYELMIPLKFWFCQQLGLSLPLIALLHTDIEISVKLKQFNEVSYSDQNVYYSPVPKLSCYMIGEYIFIEGEERSRIAKSKLEYLIEVVQSSDDQLLSSDTFKNQVTDVMGKKTVTNLIKQKLYFSNPIKEVIWVLQDINYINGSELNGNMKYHNYSTDFIANKGNTLDYVKIQFSGRDRQIYMDNNYYNYITPYQHHNSTPSDGIYMYSFSLSPEIYQPSGAANLSKIDDFYIIMKLSDSLYQKMVENNLNLRFKMYGTSYNILRIMSGQAGLAYYK